MRRSVASMLFLLPIAVSTAQQDFFANESNAGITIIQIFITTEGSVVSPRSCIGWTRTEVSKPACVKLMATEVSSAPIDRCSAVSSPACRQRRAAGLLRQRRQRRHHHRPGVHHLEGAGQRQY